MFDQNMWAACAQAFAQMPAKSKEQIFTTTAGNSSILFPPGNFWLFGITQMCYHCCHYTQPLSTLQALLLSHVLQELPLHFLGLW